MKEYWTDTILEKLVPAGTDVERGEPVRIYKADDVAELARRVLPYVDTYFLERDDKEAIEEFRIIAGK